MRIKNVMEDILVSMIVFIGKIYMQNVKLIPQMKLPEAIKEKAVEPTGFDFSRRDIHKLEIKDFKMTLKDTINWIKSDRFSNK